MTKHKLCYRHDGQKGQNMEERIKLLKAMDLILCSLDNDQAYKAWWDCMYENEEPKHLKKWEQFANDDDKFLELAIRFLLIMAANPFSKFILEN